MDLIERIAGVVGAGGVLCGEAVRERPTNWQGRGSCEARAVIRPASTDELSRVMSLCDAARQTVVVQGGATGLVRGAEAGTKDILVTLERMAAVEDCDRVAGTLTVQAGAVLHVVQERAEREGMFFPLDLGSRGSCTIGGNIATNAGGNRVLRYGMMRDQVLGLEAVLSDGTVLSSMSALEKNNTGYDLKQLFIGSEGTLGVVTRAVLRLEPLPRSENLALVAVRDFECLPKLLSLMRVKLWGTLSAFEVMWQDFYRAVTVDSGAHGAVIAPDYPCYALIESLGGDPDRDREQFETALAQATEAELVATGVIAQSAEQRRKLWAIREETASLVQALRPYFSFDISLPIRAIQNYVLGLKTSVRERWPETGRSVVFGHLGDGNIHVAVGVGDDDDDTRRELERLVYEPLRALQGSISAEHGIGIDKREHLHLCRSKAEIETMRLLKRALDPKNLLNPGKLLPRLDRSPPEERSVNA